MFWGIKVYEESMWGNSELEIQHSGFTELPCHDHPVSVFLSNLCFSCPTFLILTSVPWNVGTHHSCTVAEITPKTWLYHPHRPQHTVLTLLFSAVLKEQSTIPPSLPNRVFLLSPSTSGQRSERGQEGITKICFPFWSSLSVAHPKL